LSNTLDSIRPGQIEPRKLTQRNAYFEKLSQQLRELQGGNVSPQPSPQASPAPGYAAPGYPQQPSAFAPPPNLGAGAAWPNAAENAGVQPPPEANPPYPDPRIGMDQLTPGEQQMLPDQQMEQNSDEEPYEEDDGTVE
jgi:hypothetical protein